jgi:tRNA(Ile)-lysidine synthase
MTGFSAIFENAWRMLPVERGPVLIGLSGGADSVALLRALVETRTRLRLELHAAHLNHQLRGPAAFADAEWVEQLCRSLSVPVTIGSVDVGSAARDTGRGIEEVARDERYRFFEKTLRTLSARYVAVAHTADDQAETILHHVLRGTGLAGLCGMPIVRELDSGALLLRPLLGIRRAELRAYLSALGQPFREDGSNADETFTRNRLRRQLLPQLEREFNPQLIDALCRLGQQGAEIQGALTACAVELLDRALESATADECRLKWQSLADRPRHLVREVMTQLWRRQEWPRQRMGFDHWDRLAGIVLEGGAGDFPEGVQARRSGRLMIVGTGSWRR